MRRLFPCLLLSLSACGPGEPQGHFQFDLVVSRGLLDRISAFQVSLVSRGSSLDCVTAQASCIRDQVAATRLLPVRDAAGVQHNALVFPISLVPGTPNTQDVSLRDVPVGKDYAVIVEALSKADPPTLAGASCTYVREVQAGSNVQVVANVVNIDPAVACDPRIP